MVNVIRPGIGAFDAESLKTLAETGETLLPDGDPSTIGDILNNLLLMLFTDNLVAAAAETNLLPLIVFSIIFAGMLTTMGSRVEAITTMIVQVNDGLLSFILLLMKTAPLGIFCLVAARFGKPRRRGDSWRC